VKPIGLEYCHSRVASLSSVRRINPWTCLCDARTVAGSCQSHTRRVAV